MPSSYRVISAAHENTGDAYRRFARQALLDPDAMLQRMGRHAVTAGILSLVLVLAFLGWVAARWV